MSCACGSCHILYRCHSSNAGTLHPQWADMMSLKWLNLSGNAFSGCLPDAWSGLNLTWLDLNTNALNCARPGHPPFGTACRALLMLRQAIIKLHARGTLHGCNGWLTSCSVSTHSVACGVQLADVSVLTMRGMHVHDVPRMQLSAGGLNQ